VVERASAARVVDVVGVAGVARDREVRALGQTGEGADQRVGQLAVLVGASRTSSTYQSAWL
jgi:hypothetical protein